MARPARHTASRLALLAACLAGAAGAACGPAAPPPRAVPRPATPAPPRDVPISAAYGTLERAVVAELNRLRADPPAYAEAVEALLPLFDGKVMRQPGGRVAIATVEGPPAVREAAAALRATRPLPALGVAAGLTAAARAHVRDQGARGLVGHVGTDGSSTADRASRYGRWERRLTESIEYGSATGRLVVVSLLVDDGVRDRGHRVNLLDPGVATVGVGCGPHAKYGRMCVIVKAGGYDDAR